MLITQYDYKVSSPTKYSNFYYEFNLVKEICQKKDFKAQPKVLWCSGKHEKIGTSYICIQILAGPFVLIIIVKIKSRTQICLPKLMYVPTIFCK